MRDEKAWQQTYKNLQKLKKERSELNSWSIAISEFHQAMSAPKPTEKDKRFVDAMEKVIEIAVIEIMAQDPDFIKFYTIDKRIFSVVVTTACAQWLEGKIRDWRYGMLSIFETDLREKLLLKIMAGYAKPSTKNPKKTTAKKTAKRK